MMSPLLRAAFGLVIWVPLVGVAAEVPSVDQPGAREHGASLLQQASPGCHPPPSGAKREAAETASTGESSIFEGVQIETSDITLYELFFETILQAKRVQTMEHPQVDRLRGYCYRNLLIVVRQDLKTARPTGWVQINYVVPDVTAVQQELEQSYRTSPVAQRDETERTKIVRFKLKTDVRRGDCRAVRLEVGGPEGFMVGFDQVKEGSCKTNESQREPHHQ